MILRCEVVLNVQSSEGVLVQFAHKMPTFIGADLLQCTLFEQPMRIERFGDVETGCPLVRRRTRAS